MKDSLLYKRCMKLEKEINKLNEIIKEYDKQANEYYQALFDINKILNDKKEKGFDFVEVAILSNIVNKALGGDSND